MAEKNKTKVIIVFGGVYSSLGKGIVVSSIGKILTNLNKTVSVIKLDPYLNVDPGNMSPSQHGEVYVCKDGAQTDLDLGTYERFLEKELTQDSNVTSGRIYDEILKKERHGGYGGKTIQVVPHVTNAINERIFSIIQNENPDFLLVEVGGTVGDVESVSFVEALSQFILEYGEKNIMNCLLCPIIYLGSTTDELKTKPTQHSIRQLRSLCINPSLLILRSVVKVDKDTIAKLHFTTHIKEENIFVSPDLKSIYDLPVLLYNQNIHKAILNYFNIPYSQSEDKFAKTWISYMDHVKKINKEITIGLLGKYTSLHDAYMSVVEALRFAGYANNVNVNIKWIEADSFDEKQMPSVFKDCDGIIIPGGFGTRGIESLIKCINYIRTHNIPTMGICLGMQLMAIEYARNELGIKDAHSTEFEPATKSPIINLIDGSLQLGDQECKIVDKTIANRLYKANTILQRHRHRYAIFNPDYIDLFNKSNLKISMTMFYNNKTIVEFIENSKMTCYIGSQYHPEFHSKPHNVDPMIVYFIKQSIKSKENK